MNVYVAVSSCVHFDSCHEWCFGVGDIFADFLGLLQNDNGIRNAQNFIQFDY
jgi:hypothetical protein